MQPICILDTNMLVSKCRNTYFTFVLRWVAFPVCWGDQYILHFAFWVHSQCNPKAKCNIEYNPNATLRPPLDDKSFPVHRVGKKTAVGRSGFFFFNFFFS